MNTKYKIVTGAFLVAFVGYITYSNIRMSRMEFRLEALSHQILESSRQPVRYAFDSAFMDYFGAKGVEEVLRTEELLRALQQSRTSTDIRRLQVIE